MPQATTPAERSKIIRALVAELKLVYDKLAEATDADADANEPSEPQHVAPGPAAADSAPQRAPSIAVQAVRLRNALLLVAEEHLLHTPQHALTDQADEALWRAVFYSRIQLLRKSIHLSRLLGPTSMTIEDFAATDAAIGEIIDSISDPDAQVADALSKLSTIFMILSSDLDERFRASAGAVDASDASERRQLRFAQTVSTAGLLLLVSWSLRCLLEQIQRYAKQLEIPAISERVEAFAVVLAAFANEISSFADMDGSRERVPEDAELIGLSCMRGFYEGTEQAARQQSDADASAVRFARVAELASLLAQDQASAPAIKTMRALGLERLKDQVLSLQLGSKRLADKPRRASYPVFVLDTMSLVNGIGTIKACLMRSTCIIAVALDGTRVRAHLACAHRITAISQLDMLKEGNDTTNKRARDCIRYLEQHLKFRSLFLVSQQIKETQAFASTTMATTTTTTAMTTTTMMMMGLTDGRGLMSAVPATHRGILAYCLYLQSSVRQMPAGAVQSVSFVSDNTESVDAAIGLGVRCISLAEWKRTALAPAAMKRF
nr:hypothetical protein HK105_004208 [Polyrhizophydium stewartii]